MELNDEALASLDLDWARKMFPDATEVGFKDIKCPKCSSDDLECQGHKFDRAGEVDSWKCVQCKHSFDVDV